MEKDHSCESKSCLQERKTNFVEILRSTPTETVCPNFFVLAHANGCAFTPNCSYCYLKSSLWYLKEERAFANTDKMLEEVRRWIGRDNLESYVLNSGNLSDSLVFEERRPIIQDLVELFRNEAEAKGRPHTLLLVTKGGTNECEPLFEMEPCSNTIISFSVNSPEAARIHESGAATAEDRLEAAARLKEQGWRVRIRIDPMILGFDYTDVIEKVRELAPERVTLGSLRSEWNLFKHVENGIFSKLERPDDKRALARYPKDERIELYRPAVEALADVCSIGLCEETPDIWNALGLDTEAKSCNCGE